MLFIWNDPGVQGATQDVTIRADRRRPVMSGIDWHWYTTVVKTNCRGSSTTSLTWRTFYIHGHHAVHFKNIFEGTPRRST